MSATVAPAEQRPQLPDNVAVYRDDGPLSLAIGRALGGRVPLPAAMYVWAGLLGVVSVAETVVAWRRFARGRRTAGEFDELEGEGE